jgi:transcriptional regulator GlxA family with amidase domain
MESRLDGIMDWTRAGRKAGFRVDRLSQLTGVSAREIERYFHARFNVSPKLWLDQLRMKDAHRLLRCSASIKEVAGQLGFEKPQDFARAFKRIHGTPPSLWRNLQQTAAAPCRKKRRNVGNSAIMSQKARSF